MRAAGWVEEPSVHLAAWPAGPAAGEALDEGGRRRWTAFLAVRDAVMKALEEQRGRGVIGSPLEARVTLIIRDPPLRRDCEAHREALAEAFVVSEVEVRGDGTATAGPVGVQVARASGAKCARCWKYLASVGSQPAHPQLCERCVRVVTAHNG